MKSQVSDEIKKERLNRLMALQNDISLDINKSLKGRRLEVMIEGPSRTDEKVYTGRTSGNKIILWEKRGTEKAGELLRLKITQPQTWVLKGEAQYAER